MKNLVIGVAQNYGWYEIEPLVNSFKKYCKNADLVLFVDNISNFTLHRLNSEGVQLLPIPDAVKSSAIVVSRFTMYKMFLENHTEYEKIFCTDVKDVIFQKNIFDGYGYYKDFLVYATHAYKFKDDATNTRWFKNLFGDAEYEKIKENFIICAGVIFGSRNAMLRLFENLIKVIHGKRREGKWGDDQAALNYLILNKLLPLENLIESNFEHGEIENADYAFTPLHGHLNLPFPEIKGDKILRLDGGAAAAIHQWPSYTHTIDLVNAIYRAKDFQPNKNFNDVASTLDQVFCAVQCNNLRITTKLFVNRILYAENLESYGDRLLNLCQLILSKYNSDAEILLFAMQKTLAAAFKTTVQMKQMEMLYDIFKTTDEEFHAASHSFKIFIGEMLRNFAELLYKNNFSDSALNYLDRLETLKLPTDKKACLLRARIYREADRKEEALAAYKKVLGID